MKFTRNLPTQTRRDAWVEVNLDALEHNARQIRSRLPQGVDLMAIVKADAYGHGAVMCIPVLEASGVTMVGVASMDEALQIRQAGLEIPILVIGPIPDWSVQTAVENDIQLTVFTAAQLESFQACYRLKGKPVQVHIKVDTGMHRIGIDYNEAAAFIQHCQAQDYLDVQGVFTHLACAEDPEVTQTQYTRWEAVLNALRFRPRYIHFANSLGAVAFPMGHYNLVRMGLAFYGYLSDSSGWGQDFAGLSLKPVMGLKARIIRLMDIAPGEGVSYGHRFYAPPGKTTRIATVPLGYADGIPRLLSNRIEALYKNLRVPQVGNITMDQMMFDVTALPQVQLGETLTLLGTEGGQSIDLSHWANVLGTLEYELMCGLRVRLPKTYSRPSE